MPSNMDPGLLARLLASGQSPITDQGLLYQALEQFGGASGEAGYGQDRGYGGAVSYDPAHTAIGDPFSVYGKDGSYSNAGQFKAVKDGDYLAMLLAAAGGMYFGLPALMGEGAGAMGASGAAFGDAGMMYGGADAAAAGSLGGGGAAGAAGAGGASATMAPMEMMSTSGLGGPLSTMAGPAGASLLGGAGSWLGPAATILGGLAGAQGNNQSQSATREIPSWMRPYLDGPNGVLPMGQNLLQQQMSPESMARIGQLQTQALGLLNTPMNRHVPWTGGR